MLNNYTSSQVAFQKALLHDGRVGMLIGFMGAAVAFPLAAPVLASLAWFVPRFTGHLMPGRPGPAHSPVVPECASTLLKELQVCQTSSASRP